MATMSSPTLRHSSSAAASRRIETRWSRHHSGVARIILGMLSTGAGLFAGLDGTAPPDVAHDVRIAAVRADPCAALFGTLTDSRLPIAFFSDFNCPNCRVLDATLLDYDASHPGSFRMIRQELPLLGLRPTSQVRRFWPPTDNVVIRRCMIG